MFCKIKNPAILVIILFIVAIEKAPAGKSGYLLALQDAVRKANAIGFQAFSEANIQKLFLELSLLLGDGSSALNSWRR